MDNFQIEITELNYEDEKLIFTPPVKIDCWLVNNNRAFIVFDFGLETEIRISSFYLDLHDPAEKRTKNTIEFELIHSFCHPPEDPNYSLLNWALYGNLKNRVKRLPVENWDR